jgi:hypothetical protein
MAIVDAKLMLTIGTQDVPVDTTPVISENVIDLAKALRDPGEGRPLYWNILITTSVAHASTVNTTFVFYEHTAAAVASGTVVLSTAAMPKTALTAGTLLRFALPPGISKRYIGFTVAASETTVTAGAFRSWLDIG